MKKLIIITIWFLFQSINNSFAFDNKGFADIVEPLMPAVVNVYTTKYPKKQSKQQHPFGKAFPKGSPFEQFNEFFEQFDAPGMDEIYSDPRAASLGSGFIVDESGYIVTNHHVIEGADEISVKLNEKEIPAKLIGSDKRTDLALIKIESKTKLPFVKFGDSNKVRVGDWIIAIGNPFGLGGTVTAGIISSKGRDIGGASIVDNFIQTDAAINSGNSGGPMFNIDGEVIGVNTAIFSPSGTNIGIGFAIPSATARNVITDLKERGKVSRGLLNIQIQEVTSELAEGLGLKDPVGVLVIDVDPSGDGAKAGLKAGDLIIEFNGETVKNSRKLQIAVAEAVIGSNGTMTVLRGDKKLNLKYQIKEHEEKSASSGGKGKKGRAEDGSIEIQGMIFSNISPEVAAKFGFKSDAAGVVVSGFDQNLRRSVLAIGDVILSVGQQEVISVDDLEKAYKAAEDLERKNIVFLVKRKGVTLFIAMPLE